MNIMGEGTVEVVGVAAERQVVVEQGPAVLGEDHQASHPPCWQRHAVVAVAVVAVAVAVVNVVRTQGVEARVEGATAGATEVVMVAEKAAAMVAMRKRWTLHQNNNNKSQRTTKQS